MKSEDYVFFDEFKWAVPKAFKESLASCKFEQGDTLYSSQKAYEGEWKDALKYVQYSIQVELPVRGLKTRFKDIDLSDNVQNGFNAGSSNEVSRKSEDLIFTDNWNSGVVLNLVMLPDGSNKNIKTSQGSLYMTLWKGDVSYLEQSGRNLFLPRLPKDSRNDIPATEELLLKKYATNLTNPHLFVMPADETRDVLWSKYLKVKSIVGKNYKFQLLMLSPEEIGLPHAMEYLPTLKFACFIFDEKDEVVLLGHLKAALYVPAKNRKTTVDRFKLEMHGYLFPRKQ